MFGVYWNSSFIRAVNDCYPEYDWLEWKFVQVHRGFWDSVANCRRYLDWLGRELKFRDLDDWYAVSFEEFRTHRGAVMLANFGWSISATIVACFPEHEWCEWKFVHVPRGFWDSQKNRRRYLKWLGRELGYRTLDDWYSVTYKDFRRNHGNRVVRRYGSSVSATVTACIPRREWHEWLFHRTPPGFWSNPANRRRYVDWLGKRIGVREPKDWLKVSTTDFRKNNGARLLAYVRSHRKLLKECFPELDWNSLEKQPLTEELILNWAKAHHAATGQWPKPISGTVCDSPSNTWNAVQQALYKGLRGLPGGTSLPELLKRHGLK